MKKLLLACFILSPVFLSAQNHYIGLKLGTNFSNVQSTSELLKDATEARIGIVTGFTYEYCLLTYLRIGGELVYTQKGFNTPITFTDETGSILGEGEIITRNEYISIPVRAGVSFGKGLSFIGYLGVAPSFLVKANADSKNFQIQGGDYSHDRSDAVKSFDISGLVDLGISLKAGRFIIYLTGGYEHSFTNYNEDPFYGDTELRNTGFNVTAGGRFALKK